MRSQSMYIHLGQQLQSDRCFWWLSVLQNWPNFLESEAAAYLAEIESWSMQDLQCLDESLNFHQFGFDFSARAPQLYRLWQSYADLIPQISFQSMETLPLAWEQGLSQKKWHEARSLLAYLARETGIHRGSKLIDLGGGVGHLARLCSQYFGCEVLSVDRSEAFQAKGKALLTRQLWQNTRLHFQQLDVVAGHLQEAKQVFAGFDLSLGLHTCGSLANLHLDLSESCQQTINIACCYDKMQADLDFPVSTLARQLEFRHSHASLFLATRGRLRSLAELEKQKQVNTMRLGLHRFLQEEGLITGFISVGDHPPSGYDLGFSSYAEARLRHLTWFDSSRLRRAEQFWLLPSTQKEAQLFFLANLLRGLFARPLEWMVLLDRVLWQEELGRDCKFVSLFPAEISPRNIALHIKT